MVMKQNLSYLVGIDIGSTTVKVVVLDENKQIQYKRYERHHSKVREKTLEILRETQGILKDKTFHVAISGSAGLGVSQSAKIPFVQEVFATKIACDRLLRDIDVVVELGGEDAKILFLTGGTEERMNGTCAGGTGAFIDQCAGAAHDAVGHGPLQGFHCVPRHAAGIRNFSRCDNRSEFYGI